MKIVYSIEELARLRPSLHEVVLIGGVFDIIHAGHIQHLAEAKTYGKTLVVHLASDVRVKQKKGPSRPINPEADRAAVIAAIRYVDYVFIADVPHYDRQILEAIRPDTLMLNQEGVSAELADYLSEVSQRMRVVVSSAPKVTSTTDIIAKSQLSV